MIMQMSHRVTLAAALFGAGIIAHRAGLAQRAQDQPEEIVVYKSPT